MKPTFIPHSSYQDSVLQRLRQHYSDGIFVIVNSDWPLVAKFWMTDLSQITTLLQDFYDPKGPMPRDPASMLRSFLVFLMTNLQIGITKWVDELYRVPYYAIISGFEVGDIPGVGTFYDFFRRLWAASNLNLKSKKQKKRKRKVKKGKKGEKAPTTSPGKVKRLVQWVMLLLKLRFPLIDCFTFFNCKFLRFLPNLVCLAIPMRLVSLVTELPLSLLLILGVSQLVIVVPMESLIVAVPDFIPVCCKIK